jgi:hypothetical protein
MERAFLSDGHRRTARACDMPVRGSWVDSPWFHRHTKEELVDFDGSAVVHNSEALTQPFELPARSLSVWESRVTG